MGRARRKFRLNADALHVFAGLALAGAAKIHRQDHGYQQRDDEKSGYRGKGEQQPTVAKPAAAGDGRRPPLGTPGGAPPAMSRRRQNRFLKCRPDDIDAYSVSPVSSR